MQRLAPSPWSNNFFDNGFWLNQLDKSRRLFISLGPSNERFRPKSMQTLTQAQETNPQSPPATATDKGEVGEELP